MGSDKRKSSFPRADIVQSGEQVELTDQESDELIVIRESCNIKVSTTDTQAAVSLQVALQVAIALVFSTVIGSNDRGREIAQQLLQSSAIEQLHKQKIIIKNSKDVTIATTDSEIAVNVQVLLQILLAVVTKIEVL